MNSMANVSSEYLKYPGEAEAESQNDGILNEDNPEHFESNPFSDKKVDRKMFDADADFFQKQKQKLEAAHRIEKIWTSPKSPPKWNLFWTKNPVPRGICTPKY